MAIALRRAHDRQCQLDVLGTPRIRTAARTERFALAVETGSAGADRAPDFRVREPGGRRGTCLTARCREPKLEEFPAPKAQTPAAIGVTWSQDMERRRGAPRAAARTCRGRLNGLFEPLRASRNSLTEILPARLWCPIAHGPDAVRVERRELCRSERFVVRLLARSRVDHVRNELCSSSLCLLRRSRLYGTVRVVFFDFAGRPWQYVPDTD